MLNILEVQITKPQAANNSSSVFYTLDLSSKSLKCISSELFIQKHYQSINLSCNFIKLIPDNVFYGNAVVELLLFSNELTDISSLRNFPNIQLLKLQYNKIAAINDSLKNAKNLKVLRLDNNLIQEIKHSEFSSLKSLTHLDISSNNLEDISAVKKIVLLEELNCAHNKLTHLPELYSLKKLLEIDASFNNLHDVSGLGTLHQLSVLVLDNNKLDSLVSLKSLSSVQTLKISCNKFSSIKHIVEQFKDLEVLHIARNEISEISEVKYILNLTKCLRELNIYENPVTLHKEKHVEVYTYLKLLNLDMLDMNSAVQANQQTIMRPMSANQMMSSRYIENQINNFDICMSGYFKKLNEKFESLSQSLAELPVKKELGMIVILYKVLVEKIFKSFPNALFPFIYFIFLFLGLHFINQWK